MSKIIENKVFNLACVLVFSVLIVFVAIYNSLTDVYLRQTQFITIVVCFLYSCIFIKNGKYNSVITLGLFFTVCADYFLTLKGIEVDNGAVNQAVGTSFFVVVQIIYAIKLILESGNKKLNEANLIVRTAGSIIAVIVAIIVLKNTVNYVAIISVIYFYNLIVNIVFSFIDFKHQNLFAFALLFFSCCDLLIGLYVANGTFFTINSNFLLSILNAKIDVSWMFYRISQYLIAVSAEFKFTSNNK